MENPSSVFVGKHFHGCESFQLKFVENESGKKGRNVLQKFSRVGFFLILVFQSEKISRGIAYGKITQQK